MTDQKRMDWHLFWTAMAVILTLGITIISCYISIMKDLNTIKTVLIVKGIMPNGLAKAE